MHLERTLTADQAHMCRHPRRASPSAAAHTGGSAVGAPGWSVALCRALISQGRRVGAMAVAGRILKLPLRVRVH